MLHHKWINVTSKWLKLIVWVTQVWRWNLYRLRRKFLPVFDYKNYSCRLITYIFNYLLDYVYAVSLNGGFNQTKSFYRKILKSWNKTLFSFGSTRKVHTTMSFKELKKLQEASHLWNLKQFSSPSSIMQSVRGILTLVSKRLSKTS